MIFITNNQLNCFLIFLFLGIILGIISQIFFTLILKNKQKIIGKIVFEAIFYAFFSIIFVFFINFLNFGKFSYALIFAYLIGFFWLKKLSSKLVVFLENKWYNTLNKNRKKKIKNEKRINKT